jgi:hypothetical protein
LNAGQVTFHQNGKQRPFVSWKMLSSWESLDYRFTGHPTRFFPTVNERPSGGWRDSKKLPHKEKVRAMRELYADHNRSVSNPQEIFLDMRKRLSQVGIFSLSECNDNELMWAHYGANHSGIALGFSGGADSKLRDNRHMIAVNYVNEKPVFDVGFKNEVSFYATQSGGIESRGRVSFEDSVFRASLSTKTTPWCYEKEWRYVEETHGLFDWPGDWVSVVFGMRMSKERRREYRRLVETTNSNVDFFEVIATPGYTGILVTKL